MFIIPVDPQDSFDNQSEDYEEISSKLDSQICEKASSSREEEKVCCSNDDDKQVVWKGDWTKEEKEIFTIIVNRPSSQKFIIRIFSVEDQPRRCGGQGSSQTKISLDGKTRIVIVINLTLEKIIAI